ncbi:MAG TPA: sulfurtransferase TusA family protein [bacterium]|nr:sulfurtransferase TusA family protein [bacterium]
MTTSFDKMLDARGQKCPMPLVNARKEINLLAPGQVLKVLATDRGSVQDFQGWAKVAKNAELLSQETETVDGAPVYIHFVRRTAGGG